MIELSRRSFLKGMGAGAVALSAIGTGIPMTAVAEESAADNIAAECANKTCKPCAYPMPGSYDVDYMNCYISSQTPGAKIYYTMDGSTPTEESTYFDPWNPNTGSIPMRKFMDTLKNPRSNFIIKAIAVADGLEPSDVATFIYNFDCNIMPDEVHTELLRDRTEEMPGLIRIYDYARVNMYLVVGSTRAMLIDGGDCDGTIDVYDTVMSLTGGLPFDFVMPHGHADHTGYCRFAVEHGTPTYAPKGDWSMYERYGDELMGILQDIPEGTTWDLGTTVIEAKHMRGHSPDHVVLLDRKTGDLYVSDAFGTTDPWGPDSGWVTECTMEEYYNEASAVNEWLNGDAQRLWFGHNTWPVTPAQRFIDNILWTARNARDNGNAALIRNTRSPGGTMIGWGEYRTEPDAVALHCKYFTNADRDSGNYAKYPNYEYWTEA